MFTIKDATLKRLILLALNDLQEEGDQGLDELLQAGIDPELLDLMRHRAARDFATAARMSQLVIKVVIDNPTTAACFRRVDAMRGDQELCEYFVRHGAPDGMLDLLFKLSRHDSRRLRKLLATGTRPPGPPKVPPPEECQRIHERWAQIQHEHVQAPMREWLYHLHQQHPMHTFHELWVTLAQFGSVPALRAEAR